MAYGQGEYGQRGYGGSSIEPGGPSLTSTDPAGVTALAQDGPIEFVVDSLAGLDEFSLDVTLAGMQAIVGGVFQPGYRGSIVYDPETSLTVIFTRHPFLPAKTTADITVVDLAGNSASMTYELFLPGNIYGYGILTAHPVIEHTTALRAIVAEPKAFQYMQRLQRGDLPVYFSTPTGAYVPATVSYTLYQQRPDGTRKRVGPAKRIPVAGSFGEFYALGRAGESGQPGQWVIRWEYQQNYSFPVEEKEMTFQVVDAATLNCPTDTTVRVRKYGWN